MADIDTIKGALVRVRVSDGATPPVYNHHCLINTGRGISWSSSQTQTPIVDCDNPEDPAWLDTEVDGLSCTISGSGRTPLDDVEFWDDWFTSGATKSIRFALDKTGGSYWQGDFKLTAWDINAADRMDKAESSVTLVSTGRVTRYNV